MLANMPDPAWDEAVAAFEAATPARLVRPPRSLTIDLARIGAEWAATSAQIAGLRLYADDREGVEKAVRDELARWADPAVTVVFREVGP